MIEAQSLAEFLGAYPATPTRLRHDMSVDPLHQLPAFAALAASLPARQVEGAAEMPPALMIHALPSTDAVVRLTDLETHADYASLFAGVIGVLTPLIGFGGRTGEIVHAGYDFMGARSEAALLHAARHTIRLQMKGTADVTVAGQTFALGEDDGIYVPAGADWAISPGTGGTVQMVVEWTADEAPKTGLLARLLAGFKSRKG